MLASQKVLATETVPHWRINLWLVGLMVDLSGCRLKLFSSHFCHLRLFSRNYEKVRRINSICYAFFWLFSFVNKKETQIRIEMQGQKKWCIDFYRMEAGEKQFKWVRMMEREMLMSRPSLCSSLPELSSANDKGCHGNPSLPRDPMWTEPRD